MTASTPYTVATDGACKRNPGPAGWAWVAEDGHWSAGSLLAGTNNIGELLALLHAVQDHAHIERLVVQADSMYAIDTYRSWMDAHARRGWKTSTGQPTKNADILAALIAARDARRRAGLADIVLEHVRGHAGHRLNGWADERAVRASEHAAEGRELIWSTHRTAPLLDVSDDAPRAAKERARRARTTRRLASRQDVRE
ncbi:RNase H family protein [Microbacterium sp. HA-8]|uniref:RNase H family protein n=1 Tax=Microbacterium sp. HA-8 TaxID=3234200 RepID=UPI0038F748F5